jgi:hypothetical protein
MVNLKNEVESNVNRQAKKVEAVKERHRTGADRWRTSELEAIQASTRR